jgi:hypothetical protein
MSFFDIFLIGLFIATMHKATQYSASAWLPFHLPAGVKQIPQPFKILSIIKQHMPDQENKAKPY